MAEEELQVAEWDDHTARRNGCRVGGEFFVYSWDSENYLYTNVVGHVNHVSQINWMCPGFALGAVKIDLRFA